MYAHENVITEGFIPLKRIPHKKILCEPISPYISRRGQAELVELTIFAVHFTPQYLHSRIDMTLLLLISFINAHILGDLQVNAYLIEKSPYEKNAP